MCLSWFFIGFSLILFGFGALTVLRSWCFLLHRIALPLSQAIQPIASTARPGPARAEPASSPAAAAAAAGHARLRQRAPAPGGPVRIDLGGRLAATATPRAAPARDVLRWRRRRCIGLAQRRHRPRAS